MTQHPIIRPPVIRAGRQDPQATDAATRPFLSIETAIDRVILDTAQRDTRLLMLEAVPRPTGKPFAGNQSARGGLKDTGRLGQISETLASTLGDRHLAMPYSARSIVGAAIGAASSGVRVVVDLTGIDSPAGLAEELLRFDEALKTGHARRSLPILFRAVLRPGDISAQALMALCLQTGLVQVAMPSNATEAGDMAATALAMGAPCLMLEHDRRREVMEPLDHEPAFTRLGAARIVRAGTDVTVVAFGPLVWPVAALADGLDTTDGLSCEVIDLRSAVPLDGPALVASVERTGRLIVLEEGNRRSLLASEIAARIAEQAPGALISPVRRCRIPAPTSDQAMADWPADLGRLRDSLNRALYARLGD